MSLMWKLCVQLLLLVLSIIRLSDVVNMVARRHYHCDHCGLSLPLSLRLPSDLVIMLIVAGVIATCLAAAIAFSN